MPPNPIAEALFASAVLAGVATCTAVVAALSAGSQIFGQTLVAGTDPTEIALTFDDGPNGDTTLRLLDLLAKHEARATFFMVGQHVQQQPQIVRAVAAAGHLIGNHTMTHPWLVLKPAAVLREELRGCSLLLEDLLGTPVKYFRPPHGARRPAVMRIAAELGMKTVLWNAMGKDWLPIGPYSIVANLDRDIERKAWSKWHGSNVLLHDGDGLRLGAGREATLEAAEILLARATGRRERFVTLDAWA